SVAPPFPSAPPFRSMAGEPVMAGEALAADPARQQAMTRYYLAAAEAEGAPISDLMLLRMLSPDSGFIAEPTDPAQAARLPLARRSEEHTSELQSRGN